MYDLKTVKTEVEIEQEIFEAERQKTRWLGYIKNKQKTQ